MQDIHFHHAQKYSVYHASKELFKDNILWSWPGFEQYVESISPGWHPPTMRIWSTLCPGWYELELADQIDTSLADYDRLGTLVDDPGSWRAFAAEEVDDDSPVKSLRAAYRAWLHTESRSRVVLAALDIEAYRVREGDWPKDLSALENVPIDPYMSDPLIYSSRPDGVIVYSVGLNSKDEQGLQENYLNVDNQKDDIAFRLYNPEIRNSKPPKPDPGPDEETEYQWEESPGY